MLYINICFLKVFFKKKIWLATVSAAIQERLCAAPGRLRKSHPQTSSEVFRADRKQVGGRGLCLAELSRRLAISGPV